MKLYTIEDSLSGEIEILNEEDMIYGAEFWADRMNEESPNDTQLYATDVESAINIYESASIWVKEVNSHEWLYEDCEVRCNNCMTYFENDDELVILWNEKEPYKGCEICETDGYLMDKIN